MEIVLVVVLVLVLDLGVFDYDYEDDDEDDALRVSRRPTFSPDPFHPDLPGFEDELERLREGYPKLRDD